MEHNFETRERYKSKELHNDLYCTYCPPNKGCNRRWNRSEQRNWKQYRKYQWRVK
jgi:hypothetical protein